MKVNFEWKWVLLICSLLLVSCGGASASLPDTVLSESDEVLLEETIYEAEEEVADPEAMSEGCEGDPYPEAETSLYVLPFAVGETFSTGLTNCSSSYHSSGLPDEYAYDFDMPVGTPFIAARGGVVYEMWDEERSSGGGVGNFLIIDHGDGTYGLYYHSPKEGFNVDIGDEVEQGDVLGETGRSGLAGYPHLHFIVVEGDPNFPYQGIPISFRNAEPNDKVLQSHTEYTAGEH